MNKRRVNPAKASRVENLRKLISGSKSVAVVDYKGLSVPQATELRRNIRASGGQMKVEKNTLFKLALGRPGLNLQGLSAFIFSQTDEIAPLKTVADFAKKAGILSFKAGLLGDRILTAAEVEALAKIPGKTVLFQSLISNFQSPISRLVYSLNWNLTRLVRTLSAIKPKEVN